MHRVGLVMALAFLFLAGAFLGLYGVSFAVDGIVPGVYVGPLELGGLTEEEAAGHLSDLAGSVKETPVIIKHGSENWETDAGSLGINLDVETSLAEACRVGNTGSIFNRLAERQRVKHYGLHLKPVLAVDRHQMEHELNTAWAGVITEPVNAGFKVLPDDTIAVVPDRVGTKINYNALERDITDRVMAGLHRVQVDLPVLNVEPRRSTRDIESMEINGLIAQFSTKFDPGQAGRTYNIKVAAAALEGLLIAPGEEFSFNRVVGPRSSEAGYKTANVIVNNELVEGLGGGVCQVSSTLYNAVLLANLEVLERSNHSLPVGYVPIGRDATVVYEAVDFRFVNTTDFYLYIRSVVRDGSLTIKLYGNKDKTPPVEISSWITEQIEPSVIYEQDPNLTAGEKVVKQEGKNGYKAVAERYVWHNGEKVVERLPASLYNPVRRIVAVGTGEVRPAVVVPLDQDLKPPVVAEPTIPRDPASEADRDDRTEETEPSRNTEPAETEPNNTGPGAGREPGRDDNDTGADEQKQPDDSDAGADETQPPDDSDTGEDETQPPGNNDTGDDETQQPGNNTESDRQQPQNDAGADDDPGTETEPAPEKEQPAQE